MRRMGLLIIFLIIGCNHIQVKTQENIEPPTIKTLSKLDTAKILFQKRNFDSALKIIDSYLESYPQSDSAYFYKALIIQKQKQEDGGNGSAIEALDMAIKINPQFKEAYYYRATFELYYNVLDNGFKKIWSDINKAIEIDPNYIDALLFRASCRHEAIRTLRKDSLYRESIKDADRIILLIPNDCRAYAIRGDMKFQLGDMKSACSDWKQARYLGCMVMHYKEAECK